MKKITHIFVILLIFALSIPNANAQMKRERNVSKFVYMTSVGAYTAINNIECENRTLDVKTASVSVQQFLGYQFNNHFYMGFVAGIDVWKRTAFIPLCGSINVNFINRKWTPTWYAQAGYAFKWYVESEPEIPDLVIHAATPGAYLETGLGLTLKINQKASLLFTFNYKLQQSKLHYSVEIPGEVDYSHYATNRSQNALYHFIGVKFSVLY